MCSGMPWACGRSWWRTGRAEGVAESQGGWSTTLCVRDVRVSGLTMAREENWTKKAFFWIDRIIAIWKGSWDSKIHQGGRRKAINLSEVKKGWGFLFALVYWNLGARSIKRWDDRADILATLYWKRGEWVEGCALCNLLSGYYRGHRWRKSDTCSPSAWWVLGANW